MTSPAQKLLEDALRLPEGERADLAARLIESLDPQADDDVQGAWGAEIRRRLAELDAGSVQPIPWPEARRRILGTPHGPADA